MGVVTRVVALIAIVIAAVGLGTSTSSPAADAVSAGSHGTVVVSDNPSNHTPHVLDGYTRTFAEVGNVTLVGGNFTRVRTAASATVINRSYLFAFNTSNGSITPFAPSLNGEVFSILPTGDGATVWIVGGFSSLNGQTVRSIAKINATTGQRVASFNPPAFGGRIHDLVLRNGRLIVTGRFLTVADTSHTLLAALDPVSGALVPSVEMTFSDPRRGGSLTVYASDVTPDGSRLIVTGNFTRINGSTRYQIAMIDLTTSPPSLANWSTNRYGDGCSQSNDTYMRDVEVSPDGGYFVVVTTGAHSSIYQCDTAARWDVDSTGSSLNPVWTNYTGGDTLTAVAVSEAAVYIGGHQRWANNPYRADAIGNGAVTREGLAALDPRSGATLDWNPGRTRGWGVYGFEVLSTGLWVGSDTDTIVKGYEYRGKMAFFPTAGGTTMPLESVGTLPGTTVTLSDTGVTRRGFTGTSVTSSTTTPTTSWSGLRGAFMISGKLYTGWSDRTFKVQNYDGTTFGPTTTIPLQLIDAASINRFSTEDLASMTSMFYEQRTGRIYFTKSGQSRLFYRSFSVKSLIVGAERQDGPGNINGLDWRNVRGMFLAGDRLYTVDPGGKLTRWNWAWDGGPADNRDNAPSEYSGMPIAGTNLDVSGPTIDGRSWSGRDTFLYASGSTPPNVPPTADATGSCAGATCTFNGSSSTDPDGTIVSYAWNFGDGTPPGSGVTTSHVYAASGTYTATLTVTDNRGGVDTDTAVVTVTAPNAAPVANFTSSCPGFTCTFNGSGSTDSDGTIVSYAWTFGDGTTGSGVTTSRTYTTPGTYTVSLTVRDDDGATNTRSANVTVVDPGGDPTVTFVGAAGSNGNVTQSNVTVPTSVQAGDLLVLVTTSASRTPTMTGPTGWTVLASGSDVAVDTQSKIWTRTATATDAGSNARVTLSSIAKVTSHVAAYRGAAGVSNHALAFETVSRAEHTTPVVSVSTPGSALVSIWADKSSATTSFAMPTGVTSRNQQVGPSSGRITSAIGDTIGVPPGSAGGLIAVADSATHRATMWSLVIAPAP